MGNNMPQKPQNAADLKKLLKQYNNILTPQNKQFITELIQRLENGSDKAGLQDLAQRSKEQLNKLKSNTIYTLCPA